jgi:hypothetical protein
VTPTFAEDASRSAPTPPPGHGRPPHLAVGILGVRGHRNIAAALRRNGRDATRALALLGTTSP